MTARVEDLVVIVADLQAEMRRMKLEQSSSAVGIGSGLVMVNPMRTLPAGGWLWANGAAVSRTSYPDLFRSISPLVGTFTVTLASPGVFTLNSHGLVIGDAVYLTTTGALPTGVSANSIRYVMTVPTANTFTLGTTRSTTAVTTAVNTSGSQSGVHSLRYCPWGLGDGSTTFNVPDYRGVSLVGADQFPSGSDRGLLTWLNTLGLQGGEQDHANSAAEAGVASHGHANTLGVSLTEPNSGTGHRHFDGDDTGANTTPDAVANGLVAAHQEPGAGTAGSKRTGYATTGLTASITGAVTNHAGAAGSAHNTMQPSGLTFFVVKT